ncbi:acetyl-CoA carboxylase carboxyltransferase subunit alpha [Listeria weihenstephanensis]|uniref:Acetyl-coenzyme A carboxylase carboxyl transferase subunit alpha n=1 Tax=Listeria weihenstephanensis TaxID=1006155 RepID=A0A1S7FV23_9LIST|nr:acetyl-CoA carboxylase carboxyltransferase subunit alpha [Listeria weihenstephanensis]AQY51304.1 acetyl-CoA carboxylase subunit alpha [Listeria weihenstephanensis]MBC1500264.1 acetyl-CoA carboxylase carboxyltransferase subunit alpha [Listeria weihenstephanensis]
MANELEFEKPILELQTKIADLKEYNEKSDVDLSKEIVKLEIRLGKLEDAIYGNMSAWDKFQVARHPERPTTLDYIPFIFDQFMELHGDRYFGDDAAIVSGVATFQGMPVTVIGHQRGKDTKDNLHRNFGMPHPEGFRKALRLMKQANKFGRPIICFIDTKGAYPGRAAEERGQSEAIARNLYEMSDMTVPIISVVIGEGGSGGALGLGVGNQIYMLENAVFSVISPEGAAAILWKDAGLAKQAAESMKITAADLFDLGITDGIIPEIRGGAHRNTEEQAALISTVIRKGLNALSALDGEQLADQRYEKFKKIGVYEEL